LTGIIIKKNYEIKQNFAYTISNNPCPNSKDCDNGWQPQFQSSYGKVVVNFPFGYEKYGDNKCHCRPGFSFVNDGYGGCYCINSKKVASSTYYATNPQDDNTIYGLSDAKVGDECYTDTDCGQIKTNNNWSVDYMRFSL
jgi:hypothetical protein